MKIIRLLFGVLDRDKRNNIPGGSTGRADALLDLGTSLVKYSVVPTTDPKPSRASLYQYNAGNLPLAIEGPTRRDSAVIVRLDDSPQDRIVQSLRPKKIPFLSGLSAVPLRHIFTNAFADENTEENLISQAVVDKAGFDWSHCLPQKSVQVSVLKARFNIPLQLLISFAP